MIEDTVPSRLNGKQTRPVATDSTVRGQLNNSDKLSYVKWIVLSLFLHYIMLARLLRLLSPSISSPGARLCGQESSALRGNHTSGRLLLLDLRLFNEVRNSYFSV